jgi:hypothetical protein
MCRTARRNAHRGIHWASARIPKNGKGGDPERWEGWGMGRLYRYRSCLWYLRRLRPCAVNNRERRLDRGRLGSDIIPAPPFAEDRVGVTMHRIRQLLVLSGVMIAVLTEIGPASAQSAVFRMPGCRSFEKYDNVLRYDFSGGVCSGIVEALMSVGATLGICCPPESTVDQGIRMVVEYVDSQPARLHENFSTLAVEALRKAWPCSRSQTQLPTRR